MSISEITFIAENIISTSDKCISSSVDCFRMILNLEVEFRKKLVSADLTMIEFSDLDEVLQILVISENSD